MRAGGRGRCRRSEGGRVMDLKVTTLDGKSAGIDRARRRDLRPRAARRHPAAHGALAAGQAPGGHAQDQDARRDHRHDGKKMYKQKGTGRARHGAKAAPQFRGGGKAFGPVVRSHAHDLPKKVRALALKHALSGKAQRREADRARRGRARPSRRPRRSPSSFEGLGLANALIIDGADARGELRASPPATSPTSTCCRCRASTSTTSCAATRWC